VLSLLLLLPVVVVVLPTSWFCLEGALHIVRRRSAQYLPRKSQFHDVTNEMMTVIYCVAFSVGIFILDIDIGIDNDILCSSCIGIGTGTSSTSGTNAPSSHCVPMTTRGVRHGSVLVVLQSCLE
jgi:hypothetical protein